MQEMVCEWLWELSGAGPNGMMITAETGKKYIYVETDGVERPKGVCVWVFGHDMMGLRACASCSQSLWETHMTWFIIYMRLDSNVLTPWSVTPCNIQERVLYATWPMTVDLVNEKGLYGWSFYTKNRLY